MPILRPFPEKAGPDRGSNDPSRAFWKAEHCGRKQNFGNLQRGGNKAANVSRSSLEELLEDYRDFLRNRNLSPWPKHSREALFVRGLGRKRNVSYETYVETRRPDVVANVLICLIHQTNYLLDQLIRKLEKDFLAEGGLRERVMRARVAHRAKQRRHP
jgi:four helix bundle suffix protein